MSRMKDWALLYPKYGFSIVPVMPGGKNPLVDDWTSAASKDLEQIRKWWERWPDANIGAVMGKKSGGIRCIDCDEDENTGADGLGVMSEWERKNGSLPDSWQDISGRGGCHKYFHSDANIPNSNRTIHDDIEIRSEGLLVILPPSMHANGRRYQWETGYAPWEIPIAEADETTMKFVMPPRDQQAGKEKFHLPPEKIGTGNRNYMLFHAACSMQGTGFPDEVIRTAILELNRIYCDPSLPEKEVLRTVDSALKKQKGEKFEKWKIAGELQKQELIRDLKQYLKNS